MMKIYQPLACALAVLGASLLPAQAKSVSKMMMISNVDKKFLTDDAQGSVYDGSLALVAANRATSPALHSYGVQLIADHARLNQRLMTLGRSKGVMLPALLSDEDKTKLNTLLAKTGSALDRALIAEFVRVNAQDVKDGLKELSVTKDPAVKSAVTEFVATERKHLREAQAMQNAMGVVGPKR